MDEPTLEDCREYLRLHDKHVAAYIEQEGIPNLVRLDYLERMAVRRSYILAALEMFITLPPGQA